MKTKTHELRKRLLLTLVILAVYMAGRSLLLYGVDRAAYQLDEFSAQNMILSMVGGDRYRYTVFALGVMPYITSTLAVWIFMSLRGSEFKARLSPQRVERYSLALMLPIAAVSAVSCAGDLRFGPSGLGVPVLRAIAVLEMVAGAVVIYKMAELNRARGIGGHAPIILVNVAGNLVSVLRRFSWEQLQKPVSLCVVMAAVVLIMENVVIRVPVQRVSIHSEYADQSCIAFKLSPIGVMPIMFAASFFMLPQLMVRFLLLFGDPPALRAAYEQLDLTHAAGAVIYLGTVFVLNIAFSFMSVSPGETAEQLQKNGDSIVNVYAGRKTKKYLRGMLLLLTAVSGSILCLMMGVSLGLSLTGTILPELALFPTTAMILVGILYPLYREVKAYWKFDSYSFFI